MVPVTWEDEPFQGGGEHGEVAYHVCAKDGVGKRYAFDCGFAQFEGEDTGGGEAIEHDDCCKVAAGFVGAIEWFGENESG